MRTVAAGVLAILFLSSAVSRAATDVAGSLDRYCTSCHNLTDWAGGLDLTTLDPANVAGEAGTWEKVVRKLRSGMMPPAGEERPSRKEATSLAVALESRLDRVPASAAAPALHRLNRTEYANAIRDLLGLNIDVTGLLPPDDASEGFDNIASGLSISPALIQGYTSAALKLSRAAVGDMSAGESTRLYQVSDKLAQDRHFEGLPLGSRGGVRIEHDFPLDAQYHFSIRGSFGLARWPATVDVALDGQRIDVKNLRDFRLPVTAGRHVLTAAIFDSRRPAGVNDIYSVSRIEGAIDSVEIGGPFEAKGPGETESRKRVFVCRPDAGTTERACAERILTRLATQAFRGPQTTDDLTAALQFYEQGRAEDGFESGIQRGLARILIDPRFLFRFEATPPKALAGGAYAIGDGELASRLSFFLWSSIPDAELLELARRGELRKPVVLARQVKRMLADPKARALVDNFAGQWLHLRELETVTPEVEGFDENLRAAFIEETRSLVDWIRLQDRPITELLTADYSFLNERLAAHYRIDDVRGSHFRKVTLPASSHRRGLLGHGSILTITSTASRTSPVIRGSWILENLLSAPVPAPPPGVETNIDGDGTQAITTSVRQRLELHRQNPACASCHSVMDPVGFSLENFNAIGAWRERDGGTAIDARGTLVDGTPVSGPADLTNALIANRTLFVTNVTEKLLTYALGRALEPSDMPTVRAIVREAERNDLRFGAIVLGIVQSLPFRNRQLAAHQSVAKE